MKESTLFVILVIGLLAFGCNGCSTENTTESPTKVDTTNTPVANQQTPAAIPPPDPALILNPTIPQPPTPENPTLVAHPEIHRPPIPVITVQNIPPATPVASEKVKVGYGWSTNPDVNLAIEETMAKLKIGLGDSQPNFAVLFATVGYTPEVLVPAIQKRLNCQVFGGTSCNGILTRDGLHNAPTGSVAVLAVASQELTGGVGGADMRNISAQIAGKKATEIALSNAKKPLNQLKLALINGAPGNEEAYIAGIEEVIGKNIPIIGGSSADNTISEKWRQFANGEVYQKGVSVALIFTELNITWAYEMGYTTSEKGGKITKAEGRTIMEIDNLPAAEVYNDWTGGELSEKLQNGGSVLSDTTLKPLAKVLRGENGETHYLSIHPLSINLPERSLTVFANVEEGDELLLLNGDTKLLLSWCNSTPNKAIKPVLGQGKPLFALYVYCAGTMFALSEQDRSKMSNMINSELKQIPFIGSYSFGEQGFLPGVGNRHGNLINSTIVFSEK